MRFTLDRKGLDALLQEPTAVAMLETKAHQLADEWERQDPRQKPGGHQPPTIRVGTPNAQGVPVITDDPIWHIIEYGSANSSPYRPATRATQEVGLRFEDDRG